MTEAGYKFAGEPRHTGADSSAGDDVIAALPDSLGDRLEVLFARLVDAGLWIGAREQIQVTRLLAEVIAREQIVSESGKLDASRLRALITPLLAKTPQQTQLLREAVNEIFSDTGSEPVSMADARPRGPVARRRSGFAAISWRKWFGALVALAGAVSIFAVRDRISCPDVVCPAPIESKQPAGAARGPPTRQEATASASASMPSGRDDEILRSIVVDATRYVVEAGGLERRSSARAIANHVATAPGKRVGPGVLLREIVEVTAAGPDEPLDLSRPETLALVVTAVIETLNRTIGAVEVSEVQAVLSTLPREQLSVSSPGTIAPNTMPAETIVAQNWFSAALAALPLLWLLALLFNRRERRKAYLRRRKPEAAPFLHDLLVRTHDTVDEGRVNLALAAGRLEQRQLTGVMDIDADATVRRTIQSGGRFTPAWSSRRTKPLYLALIASQGSEDQEAQRLARLVDEIDRMGVAIERYFMQHDANVCWQRPEGPLLSLEVLADTYSDHRLIFLGTGEVFIDPATSEPWPWTRVLARWELKTLLSPVPIEDWTVREASLAELFGGPLLTATSAGLADVSRTFDRAGWLGGMATPDKEWESWSWVERPRRWLIRAPADDEAWGELRNELRHYFGRDDAEPWRWLAACAVYPAVRWDLTVYLGLELRDERGLALYTEARAARLAHLPWFRAGYMPDWLRTRLLADSDVPAAFRRRTITLVSDVIRGALQADPKAVEGIRLRLATERGIADDRRVDKAMQDEVFLDLLSSTNTSQLTPDADSLRALLRDVVERPWVREIGGLVLGAAYFAAALMVLPWSSDGAMATGTWLPPVLLALTLVTVPLARAVWIHSLGRLFGGPLAGLARLASAIKRMSVYRPGQVGNRETTEHIRTQPWPMSPATAAAQPLVPHVDTTTLPVVIEPGREPSEGREYFLSCAWGDATPEGREREALVERLCVDAESAGLRIIRDKHELDYSDRLYKFLDRIQRGVLDGRILIVLSDKYLRSAVCMQELFEVWRYCRINRAEFAARTRVFVLPSARIDTILGRAEVAIHWRRQFEQIETIFKENGQMSLAERDHADYVRIRSFINEVPDILQLVQDTLAPRSFDDFVKYGFG